MQVSGLFGHSRLTCVLGFGVLELQVADVVRGGEEGANAVVELAETLGAGVIDRDDSRDDDVAGQREFKAVCSERNIRGSDSAQLVNDLVGTLDGGGQPMASLILDIANDTFELLAVDDQGDAEHQTHDVVV